MSRFTIEGVKCENCGTMLHMGSEKMPPVPVEISFGTKADSARYPTDYMDSPNAEVHTLDRCRWQQAENKAHALHAELEQAKERLRTHEGWCDAIGEKPYLVEGLRSSNKERDALRKLVIEIAHHFDPMFGYINLHRLDDREWMALAAKAVGRDVIYPWEKADKKAIEKEGKKR